MLIQNCKEMDSALFGLGVGKMVRVNLDSKTLDYQGSDHKTRSVHRIALMVEIQNLDIPPILQARYLCNVKYCINTEHLSFEDNYTNYSRKLCFFKKKCFGHGDGKPPCLVNLDE